MSGYKTIKNIIPNMVKKKDIRLLYKNNCFSETVITNFIRKRYNGTVTYYIIEKTKFDDEYNTFDELKYKVCIFYTLCKDLYKFFAESERIDTYTLDSYIKITDIILNIHDILFKSFLYSLYTSNNGTIESDMIAFYTHFIMSLKYFEMIKYSNINVILNVFRRVLNNDKRILQIVNILLCDINKILHELNFGYEY